MIKLCSLILKTHKKNVVQKTKLFCSEISFQGINWKHWWLNAGAVSSAYSLKRLDATQYLKNCFGNLAPGDLEVPGEINLSMFQSFLSFLYHFRFWSVMDAMGVSSSMSPLGRCSSSESWAFPLHLHFKDMFRPTVTPFLNQPSQNIRQSTRKRQTSFLRFFFFIIIRCFALERKVRWRYYHFLLYLMVLRVISVDSYYSFIVSYWFCFS